MLMQSEKAALAAKIEKERLAKIAKNQRRREKYQTNPELRARKQVAVMDRYEAKQRNQHSKHPRIEKTGNILIHRCV